MLSLDEDVGGESGYVFGNGGGCGEAGRFDAHELNYAGHFTIRFDDEVGDAVGVGGHELGRRPV